MTIAITITIIFVVILLIGQHKKTKLDAQNKQIEQEKINEALKYQQEVEMIKAQEIEKEIEEKQKISNNIDFAYSLREISEIHRNFMHNILDSDKWTAYDFDKMIYNFKVLLKHENTLINKYGNEIAQKIINQEYWIGMTAEQLLESKGEPDKIEREVLKTKTKEIYLYGKKSSGDYFVLENNLVTKFVDR